MKYSYVLLIALLTCACSAGQGQETSLRLVDKAKFQELIYSEPDVVILDVRTEGEFEEGNIANSINFNWMDKETFKRQIELLDKSVPVLVYCQSGGRSAAAAAFLHEEGFKTVYDLEGGFSTWSE